MLNWERTTQAIKSFPVPDLFIGLRERYITHCTNQGTIGLLFSDQSLLSKTFMIQE